MSDAPACLERISIHIYGYNNEHAVFVYTVVKDKQSECGQPRHSFQKSQFCSVYNKMQSRSFQTKTGSTALSKVSISEGRKRTLLSTTLGETPFGLCSALKMNQWLGSEAAQPMAGKPAKARQNGRGIWLYNAGIRQGSSGYFD